MNDYNNCISFPYPYEDLNVLNEYPNKEETTHEFNQDSLINLNNYSSFGSRNNFEDDNIYEFNLDTHVDFNISALIGTKETFKVELTLKYNLEKDINKIIQSKNLDKEIKEKLHLDEDKISKEIEQIRSELLCLNKRRRDKGKEKCSTKSKKDIKIQPEANLLGRKRKDDDSKRIRDRFDTYNITKKIKNKLIQYLILSINNLIQSLYTKEEINQILLELYLPRLKSNNDPFKVILKIKHDIYAKRTKIDENLEFLGLSIKDCLSNDISEKYKGIPCNANRLIISRLLQDENNKDIFDFLFNKLKIEYWLNIFTYQKELDDYVDNSLNKEKLTIITNSLIRIDQIDLIKNDEKSKNFFHCFCILIFNFKDFLDKKERRNREKLRNEENENDI